MRDTIITMCVIVSYTIAFAIISSALILLKEPRAALSLGGLER